MGNQQQDAINKWAGVFYNFMIVINKNTRYPGTGGANTVKQHENGAEPRSD